MTVPEGDRRGRDGAWWVSDGSRKSQVYILSNSLRLATGQPWAWELWQGCEPTNVIPAWPLTHVCRATSPPKQARGQRWERFWPEPQAPNIRVHLQLQTSSHLHLPFLTWALESMVSLRRRDPKTKTDAWMTSIEKLELTRAWLEHSFFPPPSADHHEK